MNRLTLINSCIQQDVVELRDMTVAAYPSLHSKPVDRYADQRPWDGPFEGSPEELDYECFDKCDTCERYAFGIMNHARGYTGRICPVLFICHSCRSQS